MKDIERQTDKHGSLQSRKGSCSCVLECKRKLKRQKLERTGRETERKGKRQLDRDTQAYMDRQEWRYRQESRQTESDRQDRQTDAGGECEKRRE